MEKDNEGTGPLVPKEEVEELERVLVPVEALNLKLAINTPKKKRVIDLNADPSDDMESPEPLPFSGDAPSHPHVDSSLTLFTQATHMSQTPGSPTIPGLAPPTTELWPATHIPPTFHTPYPNLPMTTMHPPLPTPVTRTPKTEFPIPTNTTNPTPTYAIPQPKTRPLQLPPPLSCPQSYLHPDQQQRKKHYDSHPTTPRLSSPVGSA